MTHGFGGTDPAHGTALVDWSLDPGCPHAAPTARGLAETDSEIPTWPTPIPTSGSPGDSCPPWLLGCDGPRGRTGRDRRTAAGGHVRGSGQLVDAHLRVLLGPYLTGP